MLALDTRSALIDGEAVVARDDGLTDFDALRSALARRNGGSAAVFLYAFDLIALDGQDMRRQPWHARRDALAKLLHGAPAGIALSEHFDDDGAVMFRHACALGLEGIVSKRRDAPYRSPPCPDFTPPCRLAIAAAHVAERLSGIDGGCARGPPIPDCPAPD